MKLLNGFSRMHWARVAAEVARTGGNPMDLNVVKAIVDEEERHAGGKRTVYARVCSAAFVCAPLR